ncbi:hypothetical protein [uncultured Dechloromonas sp.]|uniref:hypothetical protein n=1 Tax=uncultured Dechloromonas sp. TaxID=171719 RepID=UPI0025E0B05C|nr:hypothetical protein [uncultured Dechloromonas sp.]
MLSIQDVLDYCDLDRGEIEAIAEHEHVPMTIAAEISEVLLCTPEGVCQLHVMFLENMRNAYDRGDMLHLQDLAESYQHLQRSHPLPSCH